MLTILKKGSVMATIMVVDDEPDIVILAEMILKRLGHKVVGAESGIAAIEKLKSMRPDLILLDLMMPLQDGWKTIKLIRKQKDLREIPIALITAGEMDMEALEKSGLTEAVDYIKKPFNEKSLSSRVSSILKDLNGLSAEKNKFSKSGLGKKTLLEWEYAERAERLYSRILVDMESELGGEVADPKGFMVALKEKIEFYKKKKEDIVK